MCPAGEHIDLTLLAPAPVVESHHVCDVADHKGVYKSREFLFCHTSFSCRYSFEESRSVGRFVGESGDCVAVPADRLDRHAEDPDLGHRMNYRPVFGTDFDLVVFPLVLVLSVSGGV